MQQCQVGRSEKQYINEQSAYLIGFGLGLVYDVLRHFQQYFSCIVAVSFIDGGNRSTRNTLYNFILHTSA